ncbi:MAG: 4Fe-4S binding protein [Sediminispirochaetaceae bacterium]
MKALRHTRTLKWKLIVQLITLAIFVFLAVQGRIQMWILIFILGAAVSLRWGRFYCGWICPMNTLFRPVRWFYSRSGPHRSSGPAFLRKPALKYLLLGLLAAFMVLQKVSGRQMPVLLILTGAAVVFTLFFDEEVWHAHLCPFGTLLEFSSSPSARGLVIDPQRCTGCGICEKVCPTSAIQQVPDTGRKLPPRSIVSNMCLNCYRCAAVCPTAAISYSAVRSPETGVCGR